MATAIYRVRGNVQGVGFRYWTRHQLDGLGLHGSAENQADGSVLVTAEGPEEALQALLAWLNGPNPPGLVRSVTVESRAGQPGCNG